jgi:hypothetical protein
MRAPLLYAGTPESLPGPEMLRHGHQEACPTRPGRSDVRLGRFTYAIGCSVRNGRHSAGWAWARTNASPSRSCAGSGIGVVIIPTSRARSGPWSQTHRACRATRSRSRRPAHESWRSTCDEHAVATRHAKTPARLRGLPSWRAEIRGAPRAAARSRRGQGETRSGSARAAWSRTTARDDLARAHAP